MTRFIVPFVTAGVVCLATDLAAGGLSFRGHPLPESRSFVVIEPGYCFRLNGPNEERSYLITDIGWMRNMNERVALGATAFVGALPGATLHFRVGLRPRVRYWLTKDTSIEGSLGPFVGVVTHEPTAADTLDVPWDPSYTRIGAAAHAAVNFADQLSFTLMAEALSAKRSAEPRPGLCLYAGARLGAGPGVVGLAAAGVLLIVAGLMTAGM